MILFLFSEFSFFSCFLTLKLLVPFITSTYVDVKVTSNFLFLIKTPLMSCYCSLKWIKIGFHVGKVSSSKILCHTS